MTLSARLTEFISACFTGLWIESHEHEDALQEISQLCKQEDWRLATWDIEHGLSVGGVAADEKGGATDPLAAIRALGTLATDDSSALLVLVNFHHFMKSPEIIQALAH